MSKATFSFNDEAEEFLLLNTTTCETDDSSSEGDAGEYVVLPPEEIDETLTEDSLSLPSEEPPKVDSVKEELGSETEESVEAPMEPHEEPLPNEDLGSPTRIATFFAMDTMIPQASLHARAVAASEQVFATAQKIAQEFACHAQKHVSPVWALVGLLFTLFSLCFIIAVGLTLEQRAMNHRSWSSYTQDQAFSSNVTHVVFDLHTGDLHPVSTLDAPGSLRETGPKIDRLALRMEELMDTARKHWSETDAFDTSLRKARVSTTRRHPSTSTKWDASRPSDMKDRMRKLRRFNSIVAHLKNNSAREEDDSTKAQQLVGRLVKGMEARFRRLENIFDLNMQLESLSRDTVSRAKRAKPSRPKERFRRFKYDNGKRSKQISKKQDEAQKAPRTGLKVKLHASTGVNATRARQLVATVPCLLNETGTYNARPTQLRGIASRVVQRRDYQKAYSKHAVGQANTTRATRHVNRAFERKLATEEEAEKRLSRILRRMEERLRQLETKDLGAHTRNKWLQQLRFEEHQQYMQQADESMQRMHLRRLQNMQYVQRMEKKERETDDMIREVVAREAQLNGATADMQYWAQGNHRWQEPEKPIESRAQPSPVVAPQPYAAKQPVPLQQHLRQESPWWEQHYMQRHEVTQEPLRQFHQPQAQPRPLASVAVPPQPLPKQVLRRHQQTQPAPASMPPQTPDLEQLFRNLQHHTPSQQPSQIPQLQPQVQQQVPQQVPSQEPAQPAPVPESNKWQQRLGNREEQQRLQPQYSRQPKLQDYQQQLEVLQLQMQHQLQQIQLEQKLMQMQFQMQMQARQSQQLPQLQPLQQPDWQQTHQFSELFKTSKAFGAGGVRKQNNALLMSLISRGLESMQQNSRDSQQEQSLEQQNNALLLSLMLASLDGARTASADTDSAKEDTLQSLLDFAISEIDEEDNLTGEEGAKSTQASLFDSALSRLGGQQSFGGLDSEEELLDEDLHDDDLEEDFDFDDEVDFADDEEEDEVDEL